MSITKVGSSAGVSTSGSTVPCSSADITVQVGDLVLVFAVFSEDGAITFAKASGTATIGAVTEEYDQADADGSRMQEAVGWCYVTGAGTLRMQYTTTASGKGCGETLILRGTASSSPIAAKNTATGASGAPASGTAAPSAVGDWFVGHCGSEGDASWTPTTTPGSWTEQVDHQSGGSGNAATRSSGYVETFEAPSTTARQSAPTRSGSNLDWISSVLVVKQSTPTISDVESDEDVADGDTAVTATGTEYGSSQGAGKLELASSSTYASATKVNQTITSWGATAIDFTVSLGALSPGTVYVFVTNNAGGRSAGFAITVHGSGPQLTGSVTAPIATVAGTAVVPRNLSGSVNVPQAIVTGTAAVPRNAAGAVTIPIAVAAGIAVVPRNLSGGVDIPIATADGDVTTVTEAELTGAVTVPIAAVSGTAVVPRNLSGSVNAPIATAAGTVEALTVAFTLAASAHVDASGEDTTALLTPPSGKTTGEFQAGRIQDDENPADAIDLDADTYTEVEFVLEASADADSGDYEFRLTDNGDEFDTYAESPTLTIAEIAELTGAVTAPMATVSGTAAVPRNLTGAITIPQATVAGTIAVSRNLSGSVTAPIAATTGIVAVQVSLTGAVTAPMATVSGTMVAGIALTGAVTAPMATAAGTAVVPRNLSGAVTALVAAVAGTAVVPRSLSGSVTAPSAVVAGTIAIAQTGVELSGSVTAPQATVTGTAVVATVAHELTGAVTAPSAAAQGSVAVAVNLNGSVAIPMATAAGTATTALTAAGSVTVPMATATGTVAVAVRLAGAATAPIAIALGSIEELAPAFLSGAVTVPMAIAAGLIRHTLKYPVSVNVRRSTNGARLGPSTTSAEIAPAETGAVVTGSATSVRARNSRTSIKVPT